MIVLDQSISGARMIVLDRSGIDLPVAVFNATDIASLSAFPSELRRGEWQWGRFACKTLLQKMHGYAPETVSVGSDAHGRPILTQPQNLPGLSLSLAHKTPYFAAAAGENVSVGVDIETRIDAGHPPGFGRYISEAERAAFSADCGLSQNDSLLLLWCFKEAYLKASGGTSITQTKDSAFAIFRNSDSDFTVKPLTALRVPILSARGWRTERFCAAVVTCERGA